MTIALQTHHLGKKYTIGTAGSGGYRTLRESLVQGAQNMFKPRASDAKQAGEFWALQDINLEIKQGERVGIIGRNGAGKSTLLKLISRITHPTTGEIRINGRVSSLLEVGTGFHPELTGRENIYLNGAILGMSRAEIKRNFDAIVDFSGVEKFLDTPVKRYSSGMYTRLAFAVAAHLESEILIVDEVLAVGDIAFQEKCLGKMEEMGKKDGRTVILVSHNMDAVNAFCNRVILLKQGKCVQDSNNVKSTVQSYMNIDDDGTQNIWDPSKGNNLFQNDYIDVKKLFIGYEDGNSLEKTVINNQEMIYIYIVFDYKQFDTGFNIGYTLYSETGETLYMTFQNDTREDAWPHLKLGTNIIRSLIPRRFLNEGSYRVELMSSLHARLWLYEPGKSDIAVQFYVKDGLSDSSFWLSKRNGILAPVLAWENFKYS